MTEANRIPEHVLADQWHAFRLKVWRRLIDAVEEAKASGLDQREIAERLGMDEGQLSRVLSGRNNVTLRNMHNIARAIDFRPEVVFTRLADLRRSNAPSPGTSWSSATMTGTSGQPVSTTPVKYEARELVNG
ncbi:hypothetical protein ACFB49_42670 [Sphingomonas sp. DBB INV C78]|uniref:helix-turn-helix domain-containing protein n=1 Tax=Sphingomonas sp. DBB INV C78 TaxID=3349434 RepID=UPI0036D28310